MIIGNDKEKVISNIKTAVENRQYNAKVEIGDPELSQNEKKIIIKKYLKNRKKIRYKRNNKIARMMTGIITWWENRDTEIVGIENVKDIKTGAIITCNHFNPLDNTVVRTFAKKNGKRRLYIISQETNLAMKGFVGFLMKYSDIIPVSNQVGYMKNDFSKIVEKTLKKNNYILIYPEQEMWFNYKVPRPPKLGAYYFSTKYNVPIISTFVEIIEKEENDTDEFKKVKYRIHILKPIYPDKTKTLKENANIMAEQDYKQKLETYEKAYNKKFDHKFENKDIAGWINKNNI